MQTRLALQNPFLWSSGAGQYPILHGPAIKAANAKALFRFAAGLADKLRDGSETKYRRWKVCQTLLEISKLVDHGPQFLPDNMKETFHRATKSFLLNYSWLARRSMESGFLHWNIVPKFHYLSI